MTTLQEIADKANAPLKATADFLRDTYTLQGKATHEDRAGWAKAWNKAYVNLTKRASFARPSGKKPRK